MNATNTYRLGGLLIILSLTLGGCGSQYYFSKPGFSQQQYDRDNYECLQAAQQPMLISPAPGPNTRRGIPFFWNRQRENCVTSLLHRQI